MPLPKPTLDNRRYDQLVGEGRALIPRLAPAWTDQNASDPGITLIELCAWLAEQNIYRFDRVSDEALRAFVRLVGVEPRMPTTAHTVVSVANANAAGMQLPARMQLADAASRPRFETTGELFASPCNLVGVMAGAAAWTDVSAANLALAPFAPFSTRPRPGHALYLGFDRALDAAGATLSLHVWTEHWQADDATRSALQAEHDVLAGPATPQCPPRDWRLHYRVTTVWEFHAGAGQWLPLADVDDQTRALSLSGFVRFTAPAGHQPLVAGGPFFIRCRIVRGRFECPPRLVHVAFNAVSCEHAVSSDETRIALAHGHAQAEFELGQAPVVAGSVQLRLDDGAGQVETDWTEVPDFERAGPFDHVVALDPERGILRSGDGLRGAILPARYQLFARWRMGGGPDGNVEAATLAALPANPHNLALQPTLASLAQPLTIAQDLAATAGAVRESLAAAQARAFDLVSAVDKAVTLADIERLALATPGVPVARVRAVASLDPRLPCYPAPGVVTLIVIPPCPRPVPLPSRDLLGAVERWLDPRRLVTSEIHAIAPRYRRVGVSATLHLACETDPAAVLRTALARIRTFFDPLDGGPEGTGWPFGRTVYRTEVMALLADVAGVRSVTGLGLLAGGASGGPGPGAATAATSTGCGGCGNSNCGGGCSGGAAATQGRCDNVTLCPHELVMTGALRLAIVSETGRNLKRSDPHECQSV
jgi:predicted phage baseplate assembly protein